MEKPRLSFWQIWNMSFGFLGIQFGFALQNANVSRIFETLGAKIEEIPILWIAAPVTGLIIQPIIGHMSDRTWNRLGRRRPYFLTGAILASLALLVMPNSPVLWMAAGMLWIMDASINVSMEPFRAFVGDTLPSAQRTIGFSMQSFFIGIGAIVASALPYIMTNWFGISNTAAAGEIPPSVKFSFYIGGAVFLLSVCWTVFSSKEYSPEELEKYSSAEEEKAERDSGFIKYLTFYRNGLITSMIGIILFLVFYFFIYMDYGLGVFFIGITAFGLIQLIVGGLTQNSMTENGLVVVINDLYKMPKTMIQLSFVQFFSWFALFAMWIYTTAGVTSTKYDMNLEMNQFNSLKESIKEISVLPETGKEKLKDLTDIKKEISDIEKNNYSGDKVTVTMSVVKFFTDEKTSIPSKIDPIVKDRLHYIQKEFNEGSDWVGVLMAVYNGFAAIMAFVLVALANKFSRKAVHRISLIIGGLGLISFYFIKDPKLLIISELGIGLAWASILAMPYAILTGSLPAKKMGVYMGIFNFFIVIPQITAAAILGFFVKTLFANQAIYALVLGGISMIAAAVMVSFVKDEN